MIKAVIFDMDGLLIDSEPLWQEAEILEFGKVGIPLSRKLCTETIGLRINEVVQYWFSRHAHSEIAEEELSKNIIQKVIELVHANGTPKEGARSSIRFLKDQKLKIGLASSSFYKIIHAVLDEFGIRNEFDVIYSAEDEPYGKPHPGIYLSAARKLGVLPEECIAIEDSLNGVRSAKAAGMKCIAVPDSSMAYNEGLVIADLELPSLNQLTLETWQKISR